MGLALFILLLILILGGVGITSTALNVLFWIAVILFVIWLFGFFMAPRGGTGRRWYF